MEVRRMRRVLRNSDEREEYLGHAFYVSFLCTLKNYHD